MAIFIVFCSYTYVSAQSLNDFRSRQNTNWNIPANWDRFNGTSWEIAAYYPGNGATNKVQVLHSVTQNVNISIPELEIFGSHNITTSSITVTGTTTIESGSFLDGSNTGLNRFEGGIIINGTGTFTSTSVTTAGNFVIGSGITQNSSGNIAFGAATFITGTQSLTGAGTGTLSFASIVNIEDNTTVTNHRETLISGNLNGLGVNSVWINNDNSILEYRGTNAPMSIGIFDVDQAGNTVSYLLNGAQTIKATNYYHLIVGRLTAGGLQTKQFNNNEINIEVLGNVEVVNGGALILHGSTAQTMQIRGNLSIFSGNAFRTPNVNVTHQLSIDGKIINEGELILHYTTDRYTDLTLNNAGEVLTGNGTYLLRNLYLTNALPKNFNTFSNIDFNGGSGTNEFRNDGGHFTDLGGTFRFISSVQFEITGSGSVEFNNLRVGNNNTSSLILQKDVRVNQLFWINYANNTSSYFDLNGFSLELLGDFRRDNTGDFRGQTNSRIIFGNGNTPSITNSLLFESGYDLLAGFTLNISGSLTLGTSLHVGDIEILSGTLNTAQNFSVTNSYLNDGIYSQTANITAFNKPGGFIGIDGSGDHTFFGFSIEAGTSVTTTNSFLINGDFLNNSDEVNAFNASAGTVTFSRNSVQQIAGSGNGTITFHELIFAGNNVKTILKSFVVTADLIIQNNVTLRLGGAGNYSISAFNVIVGQGLSGVFDNATSGAGEHTLMIGNHLIVNSGAIFNMRNAITRYCDVTINGSGNVINGSGSFVFRNLTFTNLDEKTTNTTSTLNFYGGNGVNEFRNDGGRFTDLNGLFLFRDNTIDWLISGNGEVVFNNLQIGNNNTTNLILQKNIRVNGELIFNQNTASNYLDINGFTIEMYGDHRRINNGRIRGNAASNLIIFGSGNFTSTFAFDQTTPGTTNLLNSLVLNRASGGVFILANLLETGSLTINSGIMNPSAGSIIVQGQTTITEGFIDNNNGGSNTFNGPFVILPGGYLNTLNNSVFNFGGGIINDGTFYKGGSGLTTFTASQELTGSEILEFANGNIMVSAGSVVTNKVDANDTGMLLAGSLNGQDVISSFRNEGILTYLNAARPMLIGILDGSFPGNTIYYSGESVNQDVKEATYHHVYFINGGIKSVYGNSAINGDLFIGEETVLHTREFQITGNATGLLTMEEGSELRLGRNNVVVNVLFPTNFVRPNINFSLNSLVNYHAEGSQDISPVPVYSNLQISRTGSKFITGTTTVDGYLAITEGTLNFGDVVARELTVYGDFLGVGGRITMNGGSLPHVLNLYGIINQSNRFTWPALNSTVRYMSAADQMIFSPTNNDRYGNIEIAGGSSKTLEASIIVEGNVIMTSGKLSLSDFNLTLTPPASISGTFGNNAMINTEGSGRLIKQGSVVTDFIMIYPVGSGNRYSPFQITSLTASLSGTRTVAVRAIPGRHPNVQASYDALLRYWDVVTTNINSISANIRFQYTPLDVIGNEAAYLAKRWTGSDFVDIAGSSVGGNVITVNNTNIITSQWTAYDPVSLRKTLYSYKDGDWNDIDTWTTDPSGQLLEGSSIPGNSDNVVILSGKTVQLTEDVATVGLNITIENAGILDLQTYKFANVISVLQGTGTLKLASVEMPLVALNNLVQPGGGTVEYNNNLSFDLSDQEVYNHLTIRLSNSSQVATLNQNLTVYGNLQIARGALKIFRDDPAATIYNPIILDVKGNIEVGENGSILTGSASTTNANLPVAGTTPGSLVPRYYDIYHKVYIGGNLINHGIVRFIGSDITQPDYLNLTSRGAVTVRFYGLTNNTLECYGPSDFYNLIIDKGTDQTFELNVYAENHTYFRLFGVNRYGGNYGGRNPELRKALWIRNGTLRLTGEIVIPSLTEGQGGGNPSSHFVIPANGALIMDGPGVVVLVTADTWQEVEAAYQLGAVNNSIMGVHTDNTPQELLIYGRMVLNHGYLSTRLSGGIIFPDIGGELIVNGGVLSVRQIRTGGSGNALYSQTGGTVNLLGRFIHNTTTVNTVDDLRNAVPDLTSNNGNRLNTGYGTFHLNNTANIFNMSGGEMNILNTTGGSGARALWINSQESNVNVTGGQMNITTHRNIRYDLQTPQALLPSLNISRPELGGTGTVGLRTPINIKGNLTLSDYGVLNAMTASYGVQVQQNFTIGSNAVYQPNDNTTSFTAEGDHSFIVQGNITNGLYNLQIQKASGRISLAGSASELTVRNDLNIEEGEFVDGGKTVYVNRNILNSGIHSGSGKIIITGGNNHILSGSGNGVFGNLELNELPAFSVALNADQTVNGIFSLTDGIVDLETNSLILRGGLFHGTLSHYSENRMFRTAGNASDNGLTRLINGNGGVLYPVGVNGGTNKFTPVVASISNFSDDGMLQINPVKGELPTLDQNTSGDALQYYWKIRNSDFAVLPDVSYVFTYSESDVLGDELLYRPGRVEFATRIVETSGVDTDLNTITFPIHTLTRAEYTAAKEERFQGAVSVFYSRVTNGSWTGNNWNDGNNWSLVSHTGPVAGDFPKAGDIAIIGFGGHATSGGYHSIDINTADVECADLILNSNTAPGAFQSRLVVRQNRTVTMGTVSGRGTIMQYVTPTQSPTFTADFGDFSNNEFSVFSFNMVANGTINITENISVFPNLRFEAQGAAIGNRIAVLNHDVLVMRNLTVDGNSTLRLGTGTVGDIVVNNQTSVGGYLGGRIEFPTMGERVFSTGRLVLTNDANNRISVLNTSANSLVHRLIITGNGLEQNNGVIDLFNGLGTNNNSTLEFTGTDNAGVVVTGGTNPDLFRIIVNKGDDQSASLTIQSNFTLGGTTSTSEKALRLENGELILDHPSLDINLTSGGYFQIPASAALTVRQGRVYALNNNTGIELRGALKLENTGRVVIGDDSTNDRMLIYYTGENALIEVSGTSRLEINSQIRRSTATLAGALKFRQTGGGVIIHGRNPNTGRAKLEVTNDGSEFTMSGGLLQILRGGGTTFGDLYLRPATGSITGGEILFSQGAINATQSYVIDANIPVHNLRVEGNVPNNRNATLRLSINPLTVNNELILSNARAFFNTNNRNVYLRGNLNCQGSWTSGSSDSTFLNGVVQIITGSPVFNNLVMNSTTSTTLQPASTVRIRGSLLINSGTLVDGENPIIVEGDVINEGVIQATNPLNQLTGLKLRGTFRQHISGSGTYCRIELDNISGAELLNNIHLENELILTSGIFDIRDRLLSLGLNSFITSGSSFSETNMILTDGVFGNNAGIRKVLPAGPSATIFPIGVGGKFTPVDLRVTSNASQGTVLVKPVNTFHPTAIDPSNVLQYYWVMTSEGISSFDARAFMYYKQSDVQGDDNDYLAARLFESIWTKFPNELDLKYVDPIVDTIRFIFSGEANISGEYTAGRDDAFSDEILTYTSVSSGEWNNPANWVRSDSGVIPASGPFGSRVIISEGHTINTNGNRRSAYSTTILGRLDLDASYGHNLGTVDGTGALSLWTNQLPAGRFDDFFSCTGGTMEYGGTGSYTISNRYDTFRDLVINGSGVKTLPSIDIIICNNLLVEGTAVLKNSGTSSGYRYLNVNGDVLIRSGAGWDMNIRSWVRLYQDFEKESGTIFNTNYNAQYFVMAGNSDQTLRGDFTGSASFQLLRYDNSGLVKMEGPADVRTYLASLNSHVVTSNANLFSINRPDGNGLISMGNGYFDGPLSVRMSPTTTNKLLPVGKGIVKKFIYFPTIFTTGNYKGEYMDENPDNNSYDPTQMVGPLTMVSAVEYWVINGPNAGSAHIRLPLDGTSDVASASTDLNNLRIARWNGTQWEIAGTSAFISGTINNGAVTTTAGVTFYGTDQVFTLASVQPIEIPAAQFISGNDDVCAGQFSTLSIELTGMPPWSIQYSNGVDNFTVNNILLSPHEIIVNPPVTRTYTLNSVQDNNFTGDILGVPVTISVYEIPVNFNVTGSGSFCEGDPVSVQLSGSQVGFNYNLYRDGVPTGDVIAGTGLTINFTGIVNNGSYTVIAENSGNSACDLLMNGSAVIAINPLPTAILTLAPGTENVCSGENASMTVTFTGSSPWTFTYTNGTSSWNRVNIAINPYSFESDEALIWSGPMPNQIVTFSISSVTDANSCSNVGTGSVNVNLFRRPETGPQFHIPNSFGF